MIDLRWTALVAALALAGCEDEAPVDPRNDQTDLARNDVEPIGSLSGQVSCQVVDTDQQDFDLGPAHFEGEIDHVAYTVGLRTQGCFARLFEADRGWVVSVSAYQQLSYTLAQVLELDFPIAPSRDANGDPVLLADGDEVVFSGNQGFGSVFLLNRDPVDQSVLARVAAGIVTVTEAGLTAGSTFSAEWTDLRFGELP